MKKLVPIIVLVAVVAAAGLFYVFKPRAKQEQLTPQQIKAMPYKQVFQLSKDCDAKVISENCTLIHEVNALKAQHAKEGENFWINQMLRLGEWYTYVGTKDYEDGKPEAPEIKKAVELYEWLLENKPFYGDKILLGYAKLYDSPHNAAWASAHSRESRLLYERLQKNFPQSQYAAEATAALNR